ncbi:MAG TPA: zf-TFIIB domain-containing protein [Polyangiaceae bacterium]
MKCPRCDSGSLDERERQGVTVDVCSQCRGVWLDRGELEKLLAFAKRELEEERSYYQGQAEPARHPEPARYDREPPSSDRRGYPPRPGYSEHQHRHPHGHYRKKSWLENLGEIFD